MTGNGCENNRSNQQNGYSLNDTLGPKILVSGDFFGVLLSQFH